MARTAGVVQVGLDPPAVRVPDDPDVRRLLAALGRPGGIPMEYDDLPPPAAAALASLEETGLVLAVPDAEQVSEAAVVVLRAQFGPDAARRHQARAEGRIALHADPGSLPALEPLLRQAGLARADPADLDATAHLVVTAGPVDREVLDPLVRGAVPHLVVEGGAASRRVGPFVVPGRTACMRCVDAHETLHDARRGLLVAQAASAALERPPPLDPLLDQLALAWAVRDLVRYVEGDEPSTWSTTVAIAPVAAPEVVRWGRHPECGCAWDTITLLP